MRVLAKCPRCGQILRLLLSDADKRVRCSKCGRMFLVPDLEHLQKAMKVVEGATGPVFVDQDGNIYG